MNKSGLVEKIHYLESRLGNVYNHTILEPFEFNSSNIIEVQEAAKKIQVHLGLPPLTFIISYAKQGKNTGGHIQLENSNEVFIEIDDSFKHDTKIVLAILAHEICHKYLHLNNIELHPVLENEILTDITTVYTGLGKLSLNGCKVSKITTNTESHLTHKTKTERTTTKVVGYLDRYEFSFVYKIICKMRGINEGFMLKGLSKQAYDDFVSVGVEGKIDYLKNDYFNEDYNKRLVERIKENGIENSQKNISKLKKKIRILEEEFLPSIHKEIQEFNVHTKNQISSITSPNVEGSKKTKALLYLTNLINEEKLEKSKVEIIEKEFKLRKLDVFLFDLIKDIKKTYPKKILNESKFLLNFDCPSCGHKMKIGDNKIARIKCPKCKYQFIQDAGIFDLSEEEKNKDISTLKKIKSFFGKGK